MFAAMLPIPFLLAGCASKPVPVPAESPISIRYDKPCGFANGGRMATLVNAQTDKAAKVTLRTHHSTGIDAGHAEKVIALPAGGEQLLGCNVTSTLPMTVYRFEIRGVAF